MEANVPNHPWFSHFHGLPYAPPPAPDPFSTGVAYNTVSDLIDEVKPNAWEFTGGVFASGTTHTWSNVRSHQFNFDARTVGQDTVFSGGTFYIVLTPNQSHLDYNGYIISEGDAGSNVINGDASHAGGAPIPRNDMIFGYDGNDTINGGALDDIFYGGAGDDLITGGSGNDAIKGGAGKDTYIYRPGSAADRFDSFVAGLNTDDQVDISAFTSITSFAQVLSLATQVGEDTVIDFGGGDVLTLRNVLKNSLAAEDFV